MSTLINITKAQAGYIYRPETQYTCGECVFAKGSACSFFGPSSKIDLKKGSCNYYTHGEPGEIMVPWIGVFTKEELGYVENKNGFSCKRCEYFDYENSDCNKSVCKDSPGDTPGLIHPNACCNYQEPDSKRGQMSTEEVLALIAKKNGLGSLASKLVGERYAGQ